jgi:hypothetical protein
MAFSTRNICGAGAAGRRVFIFIAGMLPLAASDLCKCAMLGAVGTIALGFCIGAL